MDLLGDYSDSDNEEKAASPPSKRSAGDTARGSTGAGGAGTSSVPQPRNAAPEPAPVTGLFNPFAPEGSGGGSGIGSGYVTCGGRTCGMASLQTVAPPVLFTQHEVLFTQHDLPFSPNSLAPPPPPPPPLQASHFLRPQPPSHPRHASPRALSTTGPLPLAAASGATAR